MKCCNNKTIIAVIILAVIIIGGFFIVKGFTGKAIDNSITDSGVREFTIKAFRFGYDPNTITVNKGDKVKITIDNIDTLHGIRIPDLGIKGNEVLEFTAEKTGEFIWYCTNMCGEGHREMSGKLIVK